jgi:enoyl-CoA hydratase/carnithine racemase
LSDLYQEKRVRAVILTGAGSSFCAGTDLHELHEISESDDALQRWHTEVMEQRDLIGDMLRFPKPIIAAVNGPALGVGAALVLASDLAIGCQQAAFSAPETLRGLVPGLVAPLLTFRCGAGLAARLCLTNETLSPAQAHHHGIYQELVADDLIWARAHEIGMQCVQSPHEAVALTKRLINETIGEHLATWLTLGAAASATARTTESALEGVAAFLKK